MYNLLQVCHNCCKKCWNFLYTLLSHLVQISRFSCSQTCHKSLASANFVSRHFFSWLFSSAEFGKTVLVSKRFSTKGTCQTLLLTKKTQCLFQAKIGSFQPALPSAKISCTRIFSAKAILTSCSRNLLPCKVEPLATIFTKSWLGSLHHNLFCKVQHRIFFCQSQLDILLQEPSPMQSGTSCSIFSKSRLGSLHHSLLCKVQHGPPSAVARAPKVKTKLSAPGSSSHNSARPGSSVN